MNLTKTHQGHIIIIILVIPIILSGNSQQKSMMYEYTKLYYNKPHYRHENGLVFMDYSYDNGPKIRCLYAKHNV